MGERTLVFPEDVAVGRVGLWRQGAWLPPLPARGTVRVPEDALVFLDLSTPIRGLGCLQPDDVHSLHPLKKSPVEEEMARVAHLGGLRELHLSKAHALGDAGLAHLAGLRRLRVLDLYVARWARVAHRLAAKTGPGRPPPRRAAAGRAAQRRRPPDPGSRHVPLADSEAEST